MRIEPQKTPWNPSRPLQEDDSPGDANDALRWWVTASLTHLDDFERAPLRRLPFACTMACLFETQRATDDWIERKDPSGERLVCEIQDLLLCLKQDGAARRLYSAEVSQIQRLGAQVLKAVPLWRRPKEVRSASDEAVLLKLAVDWGCQNPKTAQRDGPLKLAEIASQVLASMRHSDDYREELQSRLAQRFDEGVVSPELPVLTHTYLRTMQIGGHSDGWLLSRVEHLARKHSGTGAIPERGRCR